MSQKGQVIESAGAQRMMRPVAVSVVLGALLSVVVLLLLSVLVSSRNIPQSAIDPMAVFAVSLGAMAAGFTCSKIIGSGGLMCGVFSGVIFSLLVLVLSFAVPGGGLGVGALLKMMLMMFSSMLGGVVGVNTRRRKK